MLDRKHLPLLVMVAACGGKSPSSDAPDADPTIDATSGSDAPTMAGDPANDGPYQVAVTMTSIPGAATGRTLPATVFAPTTGTSRALVIISPGFQMSRTQYTSYAKHLATWGFVAVLTDYADTALFADHAKLAADIPAAITWALAQPSLAIDPSKIATAGHSLGGKLSVFAAALDTRIEAVVAWDPVDSANPSVVPERMSTMTAAIAVVGETTNASGGGMPCAPAAENFQRFYAAAPSPALALTVGGADHMDWVDDPSCGLCGFCTAGTTSSDLVHKVTRRVDVAWLRRQLFDDIAMDPWLDTPPEAVLTVARR